MDPQRHHGLDALRGGMLLLGIVLHGATFYLVEPPATLPFPTDRNNFRLFDLLFHFIHAFRMPVFFLLAGFFAARLVERRGLWGGYRDRAARVLAPLLVGMVTILPLVALLMIDFMLAARFGSHDFIPDRGQLRMLVQELAASGAPVREPALGHLWFLYYLCWFYLLLLPCRWLSRQSLRGGGRIGSALTSPPALLLLALLTAISLWPFTGGQVLEGFIFVRPHWPSLAHYALFFVIGHVLHSHPQALPGLTRYLWPCASLALLAFPLSLAASHADRASDGSVATHLAAVLVHGLCTTALVVLMIGAAIRLFDRASPWVRYVAQSSYWVYLVHMPIIALAGWWLVQYDMHAVFKFGLAVGFTTLLSFASYHYLVRRSWIGQFLNGRRVDLDWPWRSQRLPG